MLELCRGQITLGDSTFTVLVLADGREVAAERLTVRPDQVAGWDESRARTAAPRGEWRQVRREVHRALSASLFAPHSLSCY
jgi:hypothetical protein